MNEPTQPDAWRHTCVHHTDAERAAAERKCPCCAEAKTSLLLRLIKPHASRYNGLIGTHGNNIETEVDACLWCGYIDDQHDAECPVPVIEKAYDDAQDGEQKADHYKKERDSWIEIWKVRQNQLETAEARVKEVERERDERDNEEATELRQLSENCQRMHDQLTAATGLLKECLTFDRTFEFCTRLGKRIAAFLASQSVKEPEPPKGAQSGTRGEPPSLQRLLMVKESRYRSVSGTQADGSDVDLQVCSFCGYADGHEESCPVPTIEVKEEEQEEQSAALRACVEALEPFANATNEYHAPDEMKFYDWNPKLGREEVSHFNLGSCRKAADALEKAKGVL